VMLTGGKLRRKVKRMDKKAVKKVIKIEPVSTVKSVERPTAKRVCAYCRVSTGSAEQNSSFEAQVKYYTRLIEEKVNWICAGIYADQVRSGTKTADGTNLSVCCRIAGWEKSI